MSTHNIPFSIYIKENHTKFHKSGAKGLFPGPGDSNLKQPW